MASEEAAARKAWQLGDLNRGLSVAQDTVNMGRKGAELGFGVANKVTKSGFDMARDVLKGIGSAGDVYSVPGLANLLEGSESAVGAAQKKTEDWHAFAKGIALNSMDKILSGLDAAGVEKYELAKRMLGEEETEACMAVGDVVRQVRGDSGLASQSAASLITGLMRVSARQPVLPTAPQGREVDAPLARCLWLCAAMYGKLFNHHVGVFRDLKVPAGDFLAAATAQHGFTLLLDAATTELPREMYRPAHAVLVDESTRTVLVAIRGTASMRDVLNDLVCQPKALVPGELPVGDVDAEFVHGGMWLSAQRLAEELRSVVWSALDARPGYKLVVTGHSLGAGVAGLLTILWRPLLGERITCTAFASPQTLDIAAARAAEAQGVTSVLIGDDLVPRLSLRSGIDLAAAAVRLGGKDGAAASGVAAAAANSTPPTPVPALRPAGRLLHFRGGDGATLADQEDFADIRISRAMLLDHLWDRGLKELGERW